MKIKFENIINKSGYIRADYEDNENSHFIEFKLDIPLKVRNDLIAYSLAMLCGTKYNEIYMDLKIRKETKSNIETFTNAKLNCQIDTSIFIGTKSQGNHTLNFSGGFDSLAALSLVPKNTSLVSMDFGSHFSREKVMFEIFDSMKVSTNIIETNFRKNTYLFMIIGTILYKDYLNTDFNIYGDVIGAWFLKNTSYIKKYKTPFIIRKIGMNNIPYSVGLSEIGAIKLATNYYPDMMNQSLNSLANPNEEKRIRKQLFLESFLNKNNKYINITNKVDFPSVPFNNWGDNILLDHLSLYLIKFSGYRTANKILANIPTEAVKLVDSLDLNFYEKYYTDAIKYIPKHYRNHFYEKLGSADVQFFEENDWIEYRKTLNFLSRYHSIN